MQARFLIQAMRRLPIARVLTPRFNKFSPLSITRFASTSEENPQSNVSPGTASPQSSSSQGQGVNKSRATDGGDVQDQASVAKPTEQPSSSGGQDEVQGSDPSLRDPNKPADQKASEVEKQQKPLDPADPTGN